jgi:hypothetical protein
MYIDVLMYRNPFASEARAPGAAGLALDQWMN